MGRNQQWFVAHIGRMVVGRINLDRSRQAPAITPADNARLITLCLQPVNQSNNQRRFTGTANADIADHNNRRKLGDSAFFQPQSAQGTHGAIKGFQRPRQIQYSGVPAVPGAFNSLV